MTMLMALFVSPSSVDILTSKSWLSNVFNSSIRPRIVFPRVIQSCLGGLLSILGLRHFFLKDLRYISQPLPMGMALPCALFIYLQRFCPFVPRFIIVRTILGGGLDEKEKQGLVNRILSTLTDEVFIDRVSAAARLHGLIVPPPR